MRTNVEAIAPEVATRSRCIAEACSAVEHIANFTANARPEHLNPKARRLYKRNILDTIGCAFAALPGPPFRALRQQFEEYRSAGTCTLIGGGKTSPDQAALFNSGLVRYVDMLDSYMSPGGLCHPSDNFGAILAAAEHVAASGEQFLLALAVAYEIRCRFTAAIPLMDKGFNHATQLAMSAAAGAGRLLKLSKEELGNAIGMATVDNVSLACIHAEPLSQWKSFSPGITGMRAVYAASLAKRGFTGPRGLFEGPKGLEHIFGQTISVDWENPSLDFIFQTVLKKYSALIHGQPVLEATLDLRRSYNLCAAQVDHIRCDIFKAGFNFAGGGVYGPKDHVWLKEQGDYNLKYLISAALLDGEVGPEQLAPARIQSPDAQAMVARVEVCPDEELTARFPRELAARVTLWTKDGRVLAREHLGYEGGLEQPMSWERTVEKFHWLSEPFADVNLRGRVIEAVENLELQPISKLIELLAQVRSTPVYPRTHSGIQ